MDSPETQRHLEEIRVIAAPHVPQKAGRRGEEIEHDRFGRDILAAEILKQGLRRRAIGIEKEAGEGFRQFAGDSTAQE